MPCHIGLFNATRTLYVFKSIWGLLMGTVMHAIVYKAWVIMGIELLQQFSQLCARAYTQDFAPTFRSVPAHQYSQYSAINILTHHLPNCTAHCTHSHVL